MKRVYPNFLLLAFVLISPFCLHAIAWDLEETVSYEMKNARVQNEKLMTGGQPSLKDLGLLKKNGYKVIINLRGEGESAGYNEKEEAERLGMAYVSIPVEGASGVNLENALALDKALKENEGKVLIHCASSNRVGALMAIIANKVEGKAIEESLEIGRKAGMTRLEEKVKVLLEK
ncbi:beta-lactamase hydrolase domain-containing protein [Aliikangiella sp. G2MR2-5]|uniref:fused DSP-PTPase phosphatase/NAD kinase-like protein n=1 Tax=Aliikangiella sp. G2MR2-5 TaxID=2788943 RepID=UPI0018A8D3E6|nr:sulfur transferase domain-containing protein [Aliikangiella sp. G2MR2-5]